MRYPDFTTPFLQLMGCMFAVILVLLGVIAWLVWS